MADVVFPLETHAEKDGTVTHPDGRLQRVRPSASRPGDIRPNWGVLAELSLALGHDTGISSQPSAFAALTEAVPFYAGITDAEIGGRGVRWQERPAASCVPPNRVGPAGPASAKAQSSGESGPSRGLSDLGRTRLAQLGHLPRPVGRADHGAESAVEVPGAEAAGRDVGG